MMQVETLDLEMLRMMVEEQELMGAADAYKPGVGRRAWWRQDWRSKGRLREKWNMQRNIHDIRC
jgi:hypothetical protein